MLVGVDGGIWVVVDHPEGLMGGGGGGGGERGGAKITLYITQVGEGALPL